MKKIPFRSPAFQGFVIAFFLLIAYLLTNTYIYGWDDQHLEIPILKHLIDPSLYKGDYYVESASKYFTSWLYPVMAHFLTVQQVPAAYFWLFMISRYLMFYFVYRLWLLISGSVFTAFCASMTFFLLGRTDEFLYRSFCHEEFAFIFMFAGIYYFYRERYFLAAVLFGLCVDVHAIYGLFPELYMLTFLVFCHPQRFKMVIQTGLIFTAAALPFLCWQIPISISREVLHPVPVSEWMPMYMLACYQNFFFSYVPVKQVFSNLHNFFNSCVPYLFMLGLYLFHLAFNPWLRQDKKAQAVIGLSWVILGIVYVFDYIHPSRFAIDLNLIRAAQYMRFFLMGYTTLFACNLLKEAKPWLALAAAVLVLGCGATDIIGLFFLCIVAIVFIIDKKKTTGMLVLPALVVLVFLLAMQLDGSRNVAVYGKRCVWMAAGMFIVFLALLVRRNDQRLRHLLIIIPILGAFIVCSENQVEYRKLMADGISGWQLQRDWIDMQLYVRDHTPKDATVLTPIDMPMGGFRIQSERKVVVCYRDCGIVGFDYAAAEEWKRRVDDLNDFRIVSDKGIDVAAMKAIVKYGANYIVFMRYYAPPHDVGSLKKIYENAVFSLFQVT